MQSFISQSTDLSVQTLPFTFYGPARAKYIDNSLVAFGEFSQILNDRTQQEMKANSIAWLDSSGWVSPEGVNVYRRVNDILSTSSGLIVVGDAGVRLLSNTFGHLSKLSLIHI